eukprot:gnl/TRDRNA2_/TRDRNA2_81942_c0_seq1.p1 gnl/TRDRNA2_/TRDRNA2_81942_c0~~gnl/TRDRNA2_/TRDRNA2_81942_c0_seq1.p1  ORF type:complete len:127 (-),score=10.25 gnl/TRDRNA2_/TRDRNA2_81942_c0_seq1:13-393(-)
MLSSSLLKLERARLTSEAITAKTDTSHRAVVATAHVVLARLCVLNLLEKSGYSMPFARAENKGASRRLAVAKAHAVVASYCTSSSATRRAAATASSTNSLASQRAAVAKAQEALARLRGMKKLLTQ